MIPAGIRNLGNNLSRYVRRLEATGCIAVTDRARVAAELVRAACPRRTAPRSA